MNRFPTVNCRLPFPGTVSQHHDAQQPLFEMALELARIAHRLAEIRAAISLPPDLAEMEDDKIPHDVSAYLSGIIGYVRFDLLEDAVTTLKHASEITAAELRAEYRLSSGTHEGKR